MPKPYTPHDRLAKKAQFQGYRARSVFKLQELNQRLKLLKPGMKVLDIGASPGSWLQYIAEEIGSTGKALGVDLKPIAHIAKNVITEQIDINDTEKLEHFFTQQQIKQFDIVVSDIAPNTTGIPGVDHARSIELNEAIVQLADTFLRNKGTLVMKVFHGERFADFFKKLQQKYGFVTGLKVHASRDRSKEMYLVCQRKK